MVDKLEPPSLPDGYALTLGFATLLDISSCVEQNILQSISDTGSRQPVTEDRQLHETLITSSWCGLLASLSLLLDSRSDSYISVVSTTSHFYSSTTIPYHCLPPHPPD